MYWLKKVVPFNSSCRTTLVSLRCGATAHGLGFGAGSGPGSDDHGLVKGDGAFHLRCRTTLVSMEGITAGALGFMTRSVLRCWIGLGLRPDSDSLYELVEGGGAVHSQRKQQARAPGGHGPREIGAQGLQIPGLRARLAMVVMS